LVVVAKDIDSRSTGTLGGRVISGGVPESLSSICCFSGLSQRKFSTVQFLTLFVRRTLFKINTYATRQYMTWKNWGDHPIVVTISVLAGLAGMIALGYTVFSPSSSQPSINAPNSNIQFGNGNSIKDNNTTPTVPKSINSPSIENTFPTPNAIDSSKVRSLPSEKPTKLPVPLNQPSSLPSVNQHIGDGNIAPTQINGNSNQVENNVNVGK
jgi:hypothetical protein